MDIRKKVEHAIPCEKAQVTADFEPLCDSVHLKRLPDEPNNGEKARQCTQNGLRDGLKKNDRQWHNVLELANGIVEHLSDDYSMIWRPVLQRA